MKYFTGIKTVEGLWKRYRELLKKLHFDNENGSVEITQEINSEYDHFKVILDKIIGVNMTISAVGFGASIHHVLKEDILQKVSTVFQSEDECEKCCNMRKSN